MTVTGVEVAADLRDATVFVSVMGTKKEKKATTIALTHARGFLQHKIGEELELKFTPRIHIKLDETVEQRMRVEEILKQLDQEKENKTEDDNNG